MSSNPLTDPENPPLDGNAWAIINRTAVALLVLLIALPVLARVLDCFLCPSRSKSWVFVLLYSSYALLVPGLCGPLFSFNIVANLLVSEIGLGPSGGLDRTDPTTESMLGLLRLLHETGSDLGAVLVFTYAVLIPVIKMVLLLAGQFLESQRCIQVVQNISKWACPDMFAYILLMHLVRGMNHPRLLLANGRLDLGFTCFSLFCVGSTVAAMGIGAAVGVNAPEDAERGCWKSLATLLGKGGIVALVVPLALAFSVLMGVGLTLPVMALRVDIDPLYNTNGGPIDASQWKDVIDEFDIPNLTKSDVSVLQSVGKQIEWMMWGEVNSFIGFVLLAGFAVSCTVLDMVALVATAFCLFLGVNSPLLKLCWGLKKLSMLDVTIMGVVVVTFCMLMYRDKGVNVFMGVGLAYLTAAEVIHYVTFYMVKGAAEHFAPDISLADKANLEWSDSSEESSEPTESE